MNKWNGIKKHCPGCCETGEMLPVAEFRRDKARNDGRAKFCIDCEADGVTEKSLNEPVPEHAEKINQQQVFPKQATPAVEEKKRRGCPPGGWPKKEIISEPALKPIGFFDLSGWEKITMERRISEKPTVRIGKDNEIAFNMQATKQFGLIDKHSMDIHIKRGGMASQVAFLPISGDNGTVKLHNLPSYCYFNSAVVMRKINAKPGKYEIIEEGGVLFIVTTNKDFK